MVAGGDILASALVTVSMLRQLGSRLPIELWHLRDEISEHDLEIIHSLHVVTRAFEDFVSKADLEPIQSNVGMRVFQLKPLAILYSSFEEVLLIDSDNAPLRNPDSLFESKEYQSTGSLFWPDFWKSSASNPIWKIVGASNEVQGSWEQESGQILINKKSSWYAINLCVHFNSEFYMRLLNGDKETFRFAWIASNATYAMIPVSPAAVGTEKSLHDAKAHGFCGHTMLQHDPAGVPVFAHHNQLKDPAAARQAHFRLVKHMPRHGSVHAMPVTGLQLESGLKISCIDVQDVILPLVDKESIAPMPANMEHFEFMYLQALSTVESYALTSLPIVRETAPDPFEGLERDDRAVNGTI